MLSETVPQSGEPLSGYPVRYVSSFVAKNGAVVTLRPIGPQDESLMVKFHETLSDRSVYSRYFGFFGLNRRVAHERLARICACDYEHEMVLVIEGKNAESGDSSIFGVGRLNKLDTDGEAEIAVLVSDQYQGHGLGTALVDRLVQVARDWQLRRVVAEMLRDNLAMQTLFTRLGFAFRQLDDGDSVQAVFEL